VRRYHLPMLRFLPHRLQNDRRLRRLVLPAVAIAFASVLIALVIHLASSVEGSVSDRAARLAGMGDFEEADKLFVEALSSKTEFTTLIAFIDNRAAIAEVTEASRQTAAQDAPRVSGGDEAVERFLARRTLSAAEARIGRSWFVVRARSPAA